MSARGARVRSLVIIPTYNERDNLPLLVPAILKQGPDYDLLVVDDGSPDGTGELADRFAERTPRLSVIHREAKLGLGTAYVAGFRYALDHGYDLAFEMDADFSHDPADLPRLRQAVEHADLAIGSRWTRGGSTENWSLLRKAISRGGSLYARLLLGLPIRDLTSGFKCFRRCVLQALDLEALKSNGYGFQVEVNYRVYQLGFRIAEVPIHFADRTAGQSKMSKRIVLEAAGVVWQLRHTRAPEASHVPRSVPGAARGAADSSAMPGAAEPAPSHDVSAGTTAGVGQAHAGSPDRVEPAQADQPDDRPRGPDPGQALTGPAGRGRER
ncbi:MAG: glycosyltransferase [Chloroflexi bacterium]|nr:glycosyltransferase [Chloroflexota bacterium]